MRILLATLALFSSVAAASNLEQFFSSGGSSKNLYVVKSDGVTRLGRYLGLAAGATGNGQYFWLYLDATTGNPVQLKEQWATTNISTIHYSGSGCTGTAYISPSIGVGVTRAYDPYTDTYFTVGTTPSGTMYVPSYRWPATCNTSTSNISGYLTITPATGTPICGTGNCKLALLPDQ